MTAREVPVREVASGQDGPPDRGECVVRSAARWQEAWAAAGGAPPAPAVEGVDFARDILVGIFAGSRPTGGWRIEAGPASAGAPGADAGAVTIAYTVVGPGEGCMTTQAFTAPYLVLAVTAAGDGAAADVRLTGAERLDPCG